MNVELTEAEQKYLAIRRIFCKLNSNKKKDKGVTHINTVIVISQKCFNSECPVANRSYVFSSGADAFCDWIGSSAIFVCALDNSDFFDIDTYLLVERAHIKDPWRIEDIYFLKNNKRVDSLEEFDDYIKYLN